jgi:hypothetical protein
MITWLRASWPRFASGLAIAAVAGVAGVVSYRHIYEVTLSLHQTVLVAQLMPFGVDGLIVVGSVVLLQAAAELPWLGWLGVGPGVAISLFANVESGIRYGLLSAAWAGVPAASFFLATFILERWLKAQVSHSAVTKLPRGGQFVTPDVTALDASADATDPDTVRAQLNGHAAKAERLFRDELGGGKVPGIRRIQQQMHVGQPKARLIQGHLRNVAASDGDSEAARKLAGQLVPVSPDSTALKG